MIPMENIRKLSDSYRNIQEAEVDDNQEYSVPDEDKEV